jgi:hypothetical protein
LEATNTHQCYIHDVTVLEFVREECRSSARRRIKNCQRLKSLRRLSHRLKSLVRGLQYRTRQSVARIEPRNETFNEVKLQVPLPHCPSPVSSGSQCVRMTQYTTCLQNLSMVTALYKCAHILHSSAQYQYSFRYQTSPLSPSFSST